HPRTLHPFPTRRSSDLGRSRSERPSPGGRAAAPECDAARRRTRPACPNRRPVALARLRAGPCRAAPWGAPRGTGGGAVRARRGEARRRARAVVTAAGPVRWASAGSLVPPGAPFAGGAGLLALRPPLGLPHVALVRDHAAPAVRGRGVPRRVRA